ncbi:MAG: type II toxin-antitoxin system Phd/YefM family antitoxin [Chloroflexi bacterium]|nr:type II toxin-antitoxin system Phd/YefM family antitoxin [Chloroflexota bacterium]
MLQQHVRPQRAITATDMRRNFGALVNRLRTSHEHTIIESSGAPVAVLLSVAEYQDLLTERQLAAFNDFARSLGKEVEKRGLTEDQLLADLEETKREVFVETYGEIG